MTAYIWVLPHPFFALTGDDGRFVIDGIPPGNYAVEAWHERYGTQAATVEIAGGKTSELRFEYRAER
jgi:hypothetical protein